MKKLIALLLAAAMCLSLVACGGIGGKTEVVELTLDNWQDYFELTVVEHYDLNAFGEVETLELQQHLAVKEEYAEYVVCDNVAFEINPTKQRIQITLNAADQTYTLGEVVKESTGPSEVIELVSYKTKGYTEQQGYFHDLGRNYIDAKFNADPEEQELGKFVYLVPTLEHLGVTRVQGTITIKR